MVDAYLNPDPSWKVFDAFSPAESLRFYHNLLKTQGVSSGYKNRLLSSYHNMASFAVRRGYIGSNCLSKIEANQPECVGVYADSDTPFTPNFGNTPVTPNEITANRLALVDDFTSGTGDKTKFYLYSFWVEGSDSHATNADISGKSMDFKLSFELNYSSNWANLTVFQFGLAMQPIRLR